MRQPGYYWVKIDGQWMIGEFKTDSWYFCDPMMDYPGGHDGDDFEEIDEGRIERPQTMLLLKVDPDEIVPMQTNEEKSSKEVDEEIRQAIRRTPYPPFK